MSLGLNQPVTVPPSPLPHNPALPETPPPGMPHQPVPVQEPGIGAPPIQLPQA